MMRTGENTNPGIAACPRAVQLEEEGAKLGWHLSHCLMASQPPASVALWSESTVPTLNITCLLQNLRRSSSTWGSFLICAVGRMTPTLPDNRTLGDQQGDGKNSLLLPGLDPQGLCFLLCPGVSLSFEHTATSALPTSHANHSNICL
jgi:hypothetical protein